MNHAYARGQGYAFFAELALNGITDSSLPLLKDIESLAETLTSLPHKKDTLHLLESQALHQQMFGFNVFPVAGAFLTEEGQIGGPVTREARELWQQWSLRWDWSRESPEHVGEQLAILSQLCLEESQQTRPLEIERRQRIQIAVLDRLLLPWLAPFRLAVQQEKQPFYTEWASLTWQWALEHREALVPLQQPTAGEVVTPFAEFPDADIWLAEKKTGLKDIARKLLQPAVSGWFLSRGTLARLAGHLQIPKGIGSRFQMFESLLFSTIDRENLGTLLEGLQWELQAWQKGYAQLLEERPEWASVYISPWQERLNNTQRLLERLAEAEQSSFVTEEGLSNNEE